MSTCGWLGPDWSACGVCPLLRSPAALSFLFLFFLCAPTAEYDDDDSQGDDGEGVEEEEEEEDFSSEEEESDDESDSSMERYRRRGY
jgi:hypothetical protein